MSSTREVRDIFTMLPSDKTKRDIVQWLIIGAGGLVIALIIIGFIDTLGPFLQLKQELESNTITPQAPAGSSECANCLTAADSNNSFYLTLGTGTILSLPKNTYNRSQVIVLSQPENVLEIQDAAGTASDWRLLLVGKSKGRAELSVKSNDSTVSDYHIIIEVQ